jgi:hypothetical protein
MATYTVEVSDADDALLKVIAKRKWRDPDKQLCAFIEEVMAVQRARADTADKPRQPQQRRPRGTNGHVPGALVGAITGGNE